MKYTELEAAQFKSEVEAKQNVCLIDVREEYEFEDLNAGGVNIPLAEVMPRISELQSQSEIYIICNSGKRSKAIAHRLSQDLNGCIIYSCKGGVQSYFEK